MADEKVKRFISGIAEKRGFCKYETEITGNGIKGDGYFGKILKIKIINKDPLKHIEPLYFVIKIASDGDLLRNETNIIGMYIREVYFYDTVLPLLALFEKHKNISLPVLLPHFYVGKTEDKNEHLVFEDLCVSGFKLHDRQIAMDHDHIRLVLRANAQLHALSFAMKNQKPEWFEKFSHKLTDISIISREHGVEGIKLGWKKCLELLASTLSKEHIDICERYVAKAFQCTDEMESSTDNYSAILHGDSNTKNFMFKYQESNNEVKPTDIRLLDFQLTKLGSPALDLCTLIYSCASKDVIDNLEQYLRFYHDSLSAFLQQLGTHVEEVYPYSVFKEHWKQYASLGLLVAIPIIRVLLSDENEAIDLDEVVTSGKSFSDAFMCDIANIGTYKDRVHHIIIHGIENKFIQ